jgi:hypothetical protein
MKFGMEKVGKNSGEIWKVLNEKGALTAKLLEETTGLKKDEMFLALGWLIKEEKVATKKEGRSEVIYLK